MSLWSYTLTLEERGSLGSFFSSIILSSWFCLLDDNLFEWKWNNPMLLPNFHGDEMFLSICHSNFILNPGVYNYQALSKLISHTTGDCHYSFPGSAELYTSVHIGLCMCLLTVWYKSIKPSKFFLYMVHQQSYFWYLEFADTFSIFFNIKIYPRNFWLFCQNSHVGSASSCVRKKSLTKKSWLETKMTTSTVINIYFSAWLGTECSHALSET